MHDKKKIATVIVSRLGKDGKDETSEAMPEDGGGDELHALAEDLLHAVSTKSAMAVADAIRAMFLACEKSPHAEAGGEESEEGFYKGGKVC